MPGRVSMLRHVRRLDSSIDPTSRREGPGASIEIAEVTVRDDDSFRSVVMADDGSGRERISRRSEGAFQMLQNCLPDFDCGSILDASLEPEKLTVRDIGEKFCFDGVQF